jgi:hypothetical protein
VGEFYYTLTFGTGFPEFYDRGMKNTAPRELRCAPYAYGTGFTEFYARGIKKHGIPFGMPWFLR